MLTAGQLANTSELTIGREDFCWGIELVGTETFDTGDNDWAADALQKNHDCDLALLDVMRGSKKRKFL